MDRYAMIQVQQIKQYEKGGKMQRNDVNEIEKKRKFELIDCCRSVFIFESVSPRGMTSPARFLRLVQVILSLYLSITFNYLCLCQFDVFESKLLFSIMLLDPLSIPLACPQTHPKKYCCLYHFTQGKQTKASSPCYNHVPLGIINPIHTTIPRSPRPVPKDITVEARPHEVNLQVQRLCSHTHDLNQIQNKGSLPKRLAYPRVYVEKINQKNNQEGINAMATHEIFLKNKDFQEIYLLFKRFAKLTDFKTQAQLLKSIKRFALQNDIQMTQLDLQSIPQYYFSRLEFVNYLVQLGFEDRQADQFWNVAYNQARFMQVGENTLKRQLGIVSMKAFAYNYRKFYLQEMESFKNSFSQPSLRQRLIDLRLFLEPWFSRNIIFKENHQTWKEYQLELCAELRRYNEDSLYSKLLGMIEMRNKIWLFMRTLAKVIYQVTDQKNVGLEVFNDRATGLIHRHTLNLQVFVQLLASFGDQLLSSGKTKEKLFKVTDLLQYAKVNMPEKLDNIMCYLRGLFKYLYFFNKNPLLQLNRQTLNLDCTGIAQISYNDLLQFLSFKRKETNHLMEMIQAICREVNETVDARPQVQGHKRFLVECNYLAESLLKMIKRCDFGVFWRMEQVRELYLIGEMSNTTELKNILDGERYRENEMKEECWKRMFCFQSQREPSQNLSLTQRDQVFQKNYKAALGTYEDLRNKLQGKLPSDSSSKRKTQPLQSKKPGSDLVPSSKNKSGQASKIQIVVQQTLKAKHKCFNSAYCPLCDDICSTQVSSSLIKIDEMSSYLMDMLRDI